MNAAKENVPFAADILPVPGSGLPNSVKFRPRSHGVSSSSINPYHLRKRVVTLRLPAGQSVIFQVNALSLDQDNAQKYQDRFGGHLLGLLQP